MKEMSLEMNLDQLIQKIISRTPFDPNDLVPYLCQEKLNERCEVNTELARAYAAIQDFPQARVFVQRAWVFSGFSEELLPLYIEICTGLDDIEAIREAYKRVGTKKAQENDIVKAIDYFQKSFSAYARYSGLDRWEYDLEILDRIEKMAAPYRFKPRGAENIPGHRKIRVAYLTLYLGSPTSVFNRLNRLFAQFHDKSLFDVAFFAMEPESAFQDPDIIPFMRKNGSKVIAGAEIGDELVRMLWIAKAIYDFEPDLLVTDAVLADMKQYFVIALQPAPIVVSHIYGPPPQYVPPGVDWGIAAPKHPMMDSPCNCSLIDLELDLSEHTSVEPRGKRELDIPEDSYLLMSGGRASKFQVPEFWNAILQVLESHPNAYYVALGVSEGQVPFLKDLAPSELRARIKLPGWKNEYLRTLALADVVIDTFPSGSGFVLIDAMALGIPVVSFENNYMRSYDQTDWSVGVEFMPSPELIVKRGDFEQLGSLISKLITDKPYYRRMAQLCREEIHRTRGNPERMVRRHEQVYRQIISQKASEAGKTNDGNSEQPMISKGRDRGLSFWMVEHMPLDSKVFSIAWRHLRRVKHLAARLTRGFK
ncbi:MAG: glycosyltransferase [Methanosarcinales archaeon]|nr:MAG: glycosyltransferase [Methanosarcinales archaeon]